MASLRGLELAGTIPPSGPADAPAQQLAQRISSRRAKVGVIGQGYVGFPLAQRIAQCGFKTFGYDINADTVLRCQQENRFRNYRGALTALELRDCDVIIVAVPTPTRREGDSWTPDLGFVETAARTIAAHMLEHGRCKLVVFESTYAPGTTRRNVAPLLAENFELGRDYLLGYSPERIDPGNTRFSLKNTPKVTSGIDRESARLVQFFYHQFVNDAVAASSMEAAEATKILENSFRFVNITFAHEFDSYCDTIGIRAEEVTNLAATKPFGFMPFYAGPGIGGHCIAEDPYFLYESMQEANSPAPILDAALRNHEARGRVVVERIRRRLGARPLRGARILLLGVSYKPAIGDARRSPAGPILEELLAEGAEVDYHDRYVPRFAGLKSIDLAAAQPEGYDLAVLVTKHPDIDYAGLTRAGWQLFDMRASNVQQPATGDAPSGPRGWFVHRGPEAAEVQA